MLDALLSLLEDLARPYKTVASHPPHVLVSELYTLNLIADCCVSHWNGVGSLPPDPATIPLRSWQRAKLPPPHALDSSMVVRILDALRLYIGPLSDGYLLPARTLLDEQAGEHVGLDFNNPADSAAMQDGSDGPVSSHILEAHAAAIESQIQTIVAFVTASSWSFAFDYLRKVIYTIRTTTQPPNGVAQTPAAADEEASALTTLRFISSFWVDSHKLGLVIQELCSSYLHFRRPFQNTVAIVTPLLVIGWLDRYPEEFVQLHTLHKRLDGGPDNLFDMSQTVLDNGRRRFLLYPLQTTLLILCPDVFEVASNFREAKSGSMSKKVGFLDGLRKALRNNNEQAAYCLVLLLRAARHFDAESESALLSYAMDVQDEIRDAVYRPSSAVATDGLYEQDIITAAGVSLAHLNFDVCIDSLLPACLAPTAPPSFKIGMIQAASHFARLDNPEQYQPFFTAISSFIQAQLKVGHSMQ